MRCRYHVSQLEVSREDHLLQASALTRFAGSDYQSASRSSCPAVEYVVGAGDRVEFRQVGRIFRLSKVSKKGRTDDQHTLGVTERFRHQPCHVLYYRFCPNGDIKSFLDHVDGPVFAGISLEVCAAYQAITAVGKGFDAYVAVDASGTFSEAKRQVGLLRMLQAGVILSDYATLMVEILKDNARPEAGEVCGAMDMAWAKLVGQDRPRLREVNGQIAGEFTRIARSVMATCAGQKYALQAR